MSASPPVLVDSHCHLGDARFDDDRTAVIDRAVASGVGAIVCVGATGPMATNRAAVAVARAAQPEIVAVVGFHPHDAARSTPADYEDLRALCASPAVAAVGETGLDYHYQHSPPDAQREHFRRTVQLARDVARPLVVHTREAFADTATILREEDAAAVGGVIHCFTGDTTEARRFLDLGFSISVAGVVTFKNVAALHAAVRLIPRDRLLVETDSPYLAPAPHRGRRNEPAYVRHVVEAVAAIRNESVEAIARATSANAARIFGLRTVSVVA